MNSGESSQGLNYLRVLAVEYVLPAAGTDSADLDRDRMNQSSQLPFPTPLSDQSAQLGVAADRPGLQEADPNRTGESQGNGSSERAPWHQEAIEQAAEMSRQLEQRQAAEAELKAVSPTVGLVLFTAGAVEFLIPITPLGIPLMIAGALILAPHSPPFGYIDRWLDRKFPEARGKALQVACASARCTNHFHSRFQADLHRRYPTRKSAE